MDYPGNLKVVFCPYKQCHFEPFMCLDQLHQYMYFVSLQPSMPEKVSTGGIVCDSAAAGQVLAVRRSLQLPRAVSFVSTFDCCQTGCLKLKFSKNVQFKVSQNIICLI